ARDEWAVAAADRLDGAARRVGRRNLACSTVAYELRIQTRRGRLEARGGPDLTVRSDIGHAFSRGARGIAVAPDVVIDRVRIGHPQTAFGDTPATVVHALGDARLVEDGNRPSLEKAARAILGKLAPELLVVQVIDLDTAGSIGA